MEEVELPPRLLLVAYADAIAAALGDSLAREGVEVVSSRSVSEAAEALHDGMFDATVLATPVPDADLLAACAALRDLATAPPLLLIDDADHSAALRALPAEMRPHRVLVRPVEASKLVASLGELASSPDELELEPLPTGEVLTKLLGELSSGKQTGVLQIRGTADDVVTRIYFQRGRPVNAEGGSLRETLGRMLLRKGELTEDDYERVIDRMTDSVIHNEHQRMGEVLVELGILSSDDVYRALAEQVEEKIEGCYRRGDFAHDFECTDGLPDGSQPFDVAPLESMVQRGLAFHVDEEAVAEVLRASPALPVHLEHPIGELQKRYRWSAENRAVVERVDGERTLPDLLQGPRAAYVLAALLWLGDASCAEATFPALLPKKTPARQPLAKIRLKQVTHKSLETRRDPKRLQAEGLFQKARRLLAAGELSEAAATAREAVALQPSEPEYCMLEAWVLYRQGGDDLRLRRAKAVAAARKASIAEPRASWPHEVLGQLALDANDAELAVREFEAALACDSGCTGALEGLKRAKTLAERWLR